MDLELQLEEAFEELNVKEEEDREAVRAILVLMKQKSPATRDHMIRVGLLSTKIARFKHLDVKTSLFAGLLHDPGKLMTNSSTLNKTEGWTAEDSKEMEAHVMDGYRLIRGRFDFSADIIKLHHEFQKNPYPTELPPFLHSYSEGTKVLIVEHARMLALADVYDALHRQNDKFSDKKGLNDEEIYQKMLELNPDRTELVEDLYKADIFTRDRSGTTDEVSEELYESAWVGVSPERTPEDTARYVMLATALEPLSDKAGCTTRYTNVSRHLKLEFFVAGAINIDQSFQKFVSCVDGCRGNWVKGSYKFILEAQKRSILNRGGGRINQGILELLAPIIMAQHSVDPRYILPPSEILRWYTNEFLVHTSREDVDSLVEMKRFAHALCHYEDRKVPNYPSVNNVLEYYEADLKNSLNPTSIAHNGEFVNRFPTIDLMCNTIMNSKQYGFSNKIGEAFREALYKLGKDVGRGFLADCTAVAIYLCLSQNPKIKLIT